jgi:hypothetical protein
MHAVVAACDARRAGDAVAISISPRDATATAIELHDTTLALEARLVTIEHTEDAWSDAIDVTDDSFAASARRSHAGIRAEIVEPAARRRAADIAGISAQPLAISMSTNGRNVP